MYEIYITNCIHICQSNFQIISLLSNFLIITYKFFNTLTFKFYLSFYVFIKKNCVLGSYFFKIKI